MGLDIIFKEDIRNVLMAADEASSSTARVCAAVGGDGGDQSATRLYLQAYLEGYRAALTTVALAFGLPPAIITGRGEVLKIEARTVDETILADEEDATSPSAASH